ncbi:MAG: DUF2867 domain-containing protein, partial [Actinomycetes bacterium]
DAHDLYVGDALDFWRVEELEEGRLLRLRAEMRLPGLAWLEFHVEHDGPAGTTRLQQRATFAPRGLFGHLYWWAVTPFHGIVFGSMARNITRAAMTSRSSGPPRGREPSPRRAAPQPAILAEPSGPHSSGRTAGPPS